MNATQTMTLSNGREVLTRRANMGRFARFVPARHPARCADRVLGQVAAYAAEGVAVETVELDGFVYFAPSAR